MALTNTELLTRVREGLARGTGGRTDQDLNIIQSLNTCMEDAAKDVRYQEIIKSPVNITTVSSQAYLDCSAIITAGSHQSWDLIDEVLSLHIIDGGSSIKIFGMFQRDFELAFPNYSTTARTGRPAFYTKIDQRIHFYPIPDNTYPIRTLYSLWPTPIQYTGTSIDAGSSPGQASAECTLRKSTHTMISGALYYAYMILGNEEKYKSFYAIYEKAKKSDMKYNSPKSDTYPGFGSYRLAARQASAPSADAQAGLIPFDGTFYSTPDF